MKKRPHPGWEVRWRRASNACPSFQVTLEDDDPTRSEMARSHESVWEAISVLEDTKRGVGPAIRAARGTGDYSIAKIVAAIVDRIESEGVDLDTELRKLLSLYESNNHRQLVEAYFWPGNRPSNPHAAAGALLRKLCDNPPGNTSTNALDLVDAFPGLFSYWPGVTALGLADTVLLYALTDRDLPGSLLEPLADFEGPLYHGAQLLTLLLDLTHFDSVGSPEDESPVHFDWLRRNAKPLVELVDWASRLSAETHTRKVATRVRMCGDELDLEQFRGVTGSLALVLDEVGIYRDGRPDQSSVYALYRRWLSACSTGSEPIANLELATPSDLINIARASVEDGKAVREFSKLSQRCESGKQTLNDAFGDYGFRMDSSVLIGRYLDGDFEALELIGHFFEIDIESVTLYRGVGCLRILWLFLHGAEYATELSEELDLAREEGLKPSDFDELDGIDSEEELQELTGSLQEIRDGLQELADQWIRKVAGLPELQRPQDHPFRERQVIREWFTQMHLDLGHAPTSQLLDGTSFETLNEEHLTVGPKADIELAEQDCRSWLSLVLWRLELGRSRPSRPTPEPAAEPKKASKKKSVPEQPHPDLDREPEEQEAQLDAPLERTYSVVFLGGADPDAKQDQRVLTKLSELYDDKVQVEFIHSGFKANIRPYLDSLQSRLDGGADAVVISSRLRTTMGQRARKACGSAEVPWASCSNFGVASIKNSIVKAVNLAQNTE